jgi:zinc-binding alcohol dehydrogenase family protein
MKAVAVLKNLPLEDPACFVEIELPPPALRPRDLLVQVRAIAVNPVDYKVRRRPFAANDGPRVLGWDAAGVVVGVGVEVKNFKVGDEVFYAGDVTRPGANSELHAVDERIVGRKPEKLGFAEAAALPLTALTAWEALFERLAIGALPEANRGKTILLIGAAGGVGSIAIQLGKLAGLRVIATASRSETRDWCRNLGADLMIDHRDPQAFKQAANSEFILNLADTDQYWSLMAELIAPQGGICCIVENEKPVDVNLLKSKSATFAWEFMFTKSMFQTADLHTQGEILNEISSLADAGKIRSTLAGTLDGISAENLRQAHQLLESGRSIGKLVLTN